MACDTPLEGDKVRVYTYSKVNSKSRSGQFLCIKGFIVNPLQGWFYQKRSHISTLVVQCSIHLAC